MHARASLPLLVCILSVAAYTSYAAPACPSPSQCPFSPSLEGWLGCTDGNSTVPTDLQSRVDGAGVFYAAALPSDTHLWPSVANGYAGEMHVGDFTLICVDGRDTNVCGGM